MCRSGGGTQVTHRIPCPSNVQTGLVRPGGDAAIEIGGSSEDAAQQNGIEGWQAQPTS